MTKKNHWKIAMTGIFCLCLLVITGPVSSLDVEAVYKTAAKPTRLSDSAATNPLDETAHSTEIYCSYHTHVQNIGWQNFVTDGTVSGTEGQGLQLEGIEINLANTGNDIGIEDQTHVQNIGWQGWKGNGAMSGTAGQSLRIEAIQIRLTGSEADNYDLYYQVYVSNIGWLNWSMNGAIAGTEESSLKLEGIKILILPKNSQPPRPTEQPSGSITQLVNKNHSISASFVPEDLVFVNLNSTRNTQLRAVAAQGLTQLFQAASASDLTLYCRSGYSSYEIQARLYDWNVAIYGVEGAKFKSTRPGTSEHQSGLAIDVTSASANYDLSESFGLTAEGRFIKENASKYGFIIRYPEGKTQVTGNAYEPWHLRYVGIEAATAITNSGKTMEEFYGIN
ncbi:MAG: D-alanyl-D-alanine carboxypeptidase family protein [Acetobacterium sp.]